MQAETQSLALERTTRKQRAEQFSSAPLAEGGGDESPRNDHRFAEVRSRLPPQVRPLPAAAVSKTGERGWGGLGGRGEDGAVREPVCGSPLPSAAADLRSSQHFCLFSWILFE